jgi:hypothetical protein
LEAWCDPDKLEREAPYIWLFDRDGPTNEAPGKRKAPKNIFTEPEMYTITPPDSPNTRDLSLEHALSQIEGDFCSIRRDYIEKKLPLGEREHIILLTFAACCQFRTPSAREHTRSQWMPILETGIELEARMHSGTSKLPLNIDKSKKSNPMTLDKVQQIVNEPLQSLLASHVRTTVPLLQKMTKLTILCTDRTPGFITSDDPVVWFDPESYKRPPMFQGPALMYPSLEITMPISPNKMMLLTRKDTWPNYLDLDLMDLNERLLNDLNRRTCRNSFQKIIVSRNEFRSSWAEDGTPQPNS